MNGSILKPDSVKKNFVFQIFYNAAILVIPLIVSPYLTRVMGSASLGIYTYTYSIAYYFVVFAKLGIDTYGKRVIANHRGDISDLRKNFWSLYFIHLITSFIAIAAYVIYVFAICRDDRNIAIAQSIYVFSAALDITWLFYGLEKFKLVAWRNVGVKILETVCIFTLVKSPDDIGIYTLIMCISVCLGNVVMMPRVIAEIPPIEFSRNDAIEHIKPLFTLFAGAIAISLYTVFDKTLLGILATKDDAAFYEYSHKIVKILMVFTGIAGNVLFPKACGYALKGDFEKLERNFERCVTINSFISFAAAFGLASIADLLAVLYYGESFAVCGSVMICFSPLIVIMGLGEAVRQTYIYPLKKDASMTIILSISAVVNLALSSLLIPVCGIYGAVAGTISAEAVGLIAELWICRSYVSMGRILKYSLPFAVIGAIMYAAVRITANYFDGTVMALLLQAVVGAVVYLLLSAIYGVFFNREIKEIVRRWHEGDLR